MVKFNFPEGATPLDDYSGLIPRWVITLHDLNRAEAENIYLAQKKYLTHKKQDLERWFNVSWFKKTHKAMFGHVWKWAGKFRKSVTSIGIAPHLIQSRLSELCIEVLAWEKEAVDLTILERAARIHHRLVFIHPFENGNGRFSRLIADRYLLQHGWHYPHWPEDLHDGSTHRADYIESLKAADKGDYEPLISLMIEWGAYEFKK